MNVVAVFFFLQILDRGRIWAFPKTIQPPRKEIKMISGFIPVGFFDNERTMDPRKKLMREMKGFKRASSKLIFGALETIAEETTLLEKFYKSDKAFLGQVKKIKNTAISAMKLARPGYSFDPKEKRLAISNDGDFGKAIFLPLKGYLVVQIIILADFLLAKTKRPKTINADVWTKMKEQFIKMDHVLFNLCPKYIPNKDEKYYDGIESNPFNL